MSDIIDEKGELMRAIVVVDKNWGIGKKNDLLFRLPADMKHFRETTAGKVVVMGSNTLLSFPEGKPLKNRTNIVLWPGGEKREDCIVVDSLERLFSEVAKYHGEEVYVLGGAMMYRTLLPYCDEAVVTKVEADGGAEVFFENLDKKAEWSLISEGEPIETNGYTIRFCLYRNGAVLPRLNLYK